MTTYDDFFSGILLSSVKGVLIDIDDTLYSYGPTHDYALRICFARLIDQGYSHKSFEEFEAIYRQKRDRVTQRLKPQGACRSRFFAFQEMFEDWQRQGISINSYVYAEMMDEAYWCSFVSQMTVRSGARDFLNKCKENNIKVCAVTDMLAKVQVRKIQQLNLEKHIDFLVTSEEVGREKPAKQMFLLALEKMNLNADEVIMIGDDKLKDICGAEQVGIKAFQVR